MFDSAQVAVFDTAGSRRLRRGEGPERSVRMAQGSSGFDMSKLSTADKIVLGVAAVFFIWVFLPFWYSCCSAFGVSLPGGSFSGFRGVLIISWLLSIVAIAEIVTNRMMGMNFSLPAKRGLTHLVVAALALIFTLLGLVAKQRGEVVAAARVVRSPHRAQPE
jgi:hypothetical protein